MTTKDSSSDASVAAVSALVDQAARLGLLWRIMPASVIRTPTNANNVIVSVDGDSANGRAQSLIGRVDAGTRVMVLVVPPSNIYIIGLYGVNTPALNPATPMYQSGANDISVSAAASATLAINFARPFPSAPTVCTNINSGVAAAGGWQSRAINITATGCTLFIFGASSTFTASVQWQAQATTQ